MHNFDCLHGSVKALGDGFLQFIRRVSKFTGKVAQERSEKEHLHIIISCYGVQMLASVAFGG